MSSCSYCRKRFPDNYCFCPFCGRNLFANASAPIQNSYPSNINYNRNIQKRVVSDPELEGAIAMKAVAFGMMTAVFTFLGLLLNFLIPGLGILFGIPGLVFAILALKFSKEFKDNFGSIYGIARAGKILAIIGLANCGIILIAVLLYALLNYISSWA